MAARYGAETPVLEWRERLVCSQCGDRQVDFGAARRGRSAGYAPSRGAATEPGATRSDQARRAVE
jgi:hypothetical protein